MAGFDDLVACATFHLVTAACPDRVWTALTCPRETTRYFHGLSVRSSWTAEAPVYFYLAGDAPGPSGEVLCARPPEHLAYSIEDAGSCTATYLTWTIRTGSAGTVVRLRVEEMDGGADGEDELEDVWLPVVEALRAVLGSSGDRSTVI